MLQITYRNMTSTHAVWEVARQKYQKVEAQVHGTPFCSVVVIHQPGRARKDEQYCAHIDFRLNGATKVHATVEAEHPQTAVRDVFALLERRLAARHESFERAVH